MSPKSGASEPFVSHSQCNFIIFWINIYKKKLSILCLLHALEAMLTYTTHYLGITSLEILKRIGNARAETGECVSKWCEFVGLIDSPLFVVSISTLNSFQFYFFFAWPFHKLCEKPTCLCFSSSIYYVLDKSYKWKKKKTKNTWEF